VVNPVDCHESDETRWWVRLRCGECAWSREAIITNAEAKQLERELEPGLREIAVLSLHPPILAGLRRRVIHDRSVDPG
jgi:hypothetical protein